MFSFSRFERWVWPLARIHFYGSSFLERDCLGGGVFGPASCSSEGRGIVYRRFERGVEVVGLLYNVIIYIRICTSPMMIT